MFQFLGSFRFGHRNARKKSISVSPNPLGIHGQEGHKVSGLKDVDNHHAYSAINAEGEKGRKDLKINMNLESHGQALETCFESRFFALELFFQKLASA